MSDEYIKKSDIQYGYYPVAPILEGGSIMWKKIAFVNEIDKIPSADVAPVVRCKDCEWRNWETNGCNRNPCVEPWFENDFCSYGERKDKEADK